MNQLFYMVYLNIEKKVWAIKTKEYKVIENISMKDLKWFKAEYKAIIKKKQDQIKELDNK